MIKSHALRLLNSAAIQTRSLKVKSQTSPVTEATSLPRDYSVRETIKHVLDQYKEKDPFYIVHLSNIEAQYKRWQQNLPNIHPHYAIKSNPDRRIIQYLSSLGSNFDCASMKEIQDVMSITKNPKRIIFANPFKIPYHLEYAASIGVDRVTADNVSELEKLRFYHKNAQILIRLKPDDSKSLCKFSAKFGATIPEAIEMLKYAQSYNQDIVGCSFHVGSGCQSAQTYVDVLSDSAQIFQAGTQMGFHMNLLDIGGGFPGRYASGNGPTFEDMAQSIHQTIEDKFSDYKDLELISEPGRYFSAASSTLVTTVMGKKEYQENGQKGFKYYLDDGVYGSFNCIVNDHAVIDLKVVKPRINPVSYPSIVWGPTCDSIDKIGEFNMPELFIGDKLFVENFGAYTTTAGSAFNGFKNVNRYYVYQE